MNITLQLAKTNPNFNRDDNHRPMFYNADVKKGTKTIQDVKDAWSANIFDANAINVSSTWNEPSFNKANVQLPVTENEMESTKQISYALIKRDGIEKYYFIDTVQVMNKNTLKFTLTLDVITTYLDKLTFGKSTKIERKHFNRWILSNDKTSIKANFSEESGIWNKDSSLDFSTFIKTDIYPINVLNDDIKKHIEFLGNGTFLPYAFMKIKNDSVAPQLHVFKGSPNNRIFNSLVYPLATPESQSINAYFLSKNFSADIEKIFILPLPLFNTVLGKNVDGHEDAILADTDKDGNKIYDLYVGNKDVYNTRTLIQGEAGMDGTYTLYDSREINRHTYSYKFSLKDLNEKNINTLSKKYNFENESKLLSSEHLKIILSSINQQTTNIVNEFVMEDDEIEFDISQAINLDGSYMFVKCLNNKYQSYNKDNTKTFVVSYKDQMPNASSAYAEFVRTQGNQYKTAIANNRIQTGISAGVAGAAALSKMNPLGVLGGLAGATSGVLKERQMKAKISDLKNMGTTTETSDYSILKDLSNLDNGDYGDTALTLSFEKHPIIQQKEISTFYNKYGYETDLIIKIDDYSSLANRSLFSFWKAPKFSNAINKININNQVITEINILFDQGITFWNVDSTGKVDINNYENENWEFDIAEVII